MWRGCGKDEVGGGGDEADGERAGVRLARRAVRMAGHAERGRAYLKGT